MVKAVIRRIEFLNTLNYNALSQYCKYRGSRQQQELVLNKLRSTKT